MPDHTVPGAFRSSGSSRRRKRTIIQCQAHSDLLDLPEEEKEGLVKIGEERSRKLAKSLASYHIKVYVRPRYAVKGDSSAEVIVCDLPDFAIPGSQFDAIIQCHDHTVPGTN